MNIPPKGEMKQGKRFKILDTISWWKLKWSSFTVQPYSFLPSYSLVSATAHCSTSNLDPITTYNILCISDPYSLVLYPSSLFLGLVSAILYPWSVLILYPWTALILYPWTALILYPWTALILYPWTALILYPWTPLILYPRTALILYPWTALILYSWTALILYPWTALILYPWTALIFYPLFVIHD